MLRIYHDSSMLPYIFSYQLAEKDPQLDPAGGLFPYSTPCTHNPMYVAHANMQMEEQSLKHNPLAQHLHDSEEGELFPQRGYTEMADWLLSDTGGDLLGTQVLDHGSARHGISQSRPPAAHRKVRVNHPITSWSQQKRKVRVQPNRSACL